MKRFYVILAVSVTGMFLSYCHSSKKAMSTAPKMTFETGLMPVIVASCSPCHVPSKGGNKTAYDNYTNVSTHIDEMIRRIELNPTDRGFMPMRGAKLSDSTIALFKQWKADGLLEK